uniref:Uncharacterized protein n=1 Tax=Arundo donax TaxID=35708 RepID=A0A0A9EYK6_ARUDO
MMLTMKLGRQLCPRNHHQWLMPTSSMRGMMRKSTWTKWNIEMVDTEASVDKLSYQLFPRWNIEMVDTEASGDKLSYQLFPMYKVLPI